MIKAFMEILCLIIGSLKHSGFHGLPNLRKFLKLPIDSELTPSGQHRGNILHKLACCAEDHKRPLKSSKTSDMKKVVLHSQTSFFQYNLVFFLSKNGPENITSSINKSTDCVNHAARSERGKLAPSLAVRIGKFVVGSNCNKTLTLNFSENYR